VSSSPARLLFLVSTGASSKQASAAPAAAPTLSALQPPKSDQISQKLHFTLGKQRDCQRRVNERPPPFFAPPNLYHKPALDPHPQRRGCVGLCATTMLRKALSARACLSPPLSSPVLGLMLVVVSPIALVTASLLPCLFLNTRASAEGRAGVVQRDHPGSVALVH